MPLVDLDQYLAEQNADPLVVKFAGKEYKAPAEIPWTALQKAQEIDGKEVGQEQIGEIVSLFLGPDAWKQMLSDGLGLKGAIQVMNALMEEAMKNLPGDGDPKAMLEEILARQESGSKSPSETVPETSAS